MKRLLLAFFATATTLFAVDISSFNGTWLIKSAEMNGDDVAANFTDGIVMTM